MELSPTGFASGPPTGGVVLGGFFRRGMLGLRLDYAYEKAESDDREVWTAQLGLAGRFRLARSDDQRAELGLGVDWGFRRATYEGVDFRGDPVTYEASGSAFGIGPFVRYWFHRHIAIGYAMQFTLVSLEITGDDGDDGSKIDQYGWTGGFTLTSRF